MSQTLDQPAAPAVDSTSTPVRRRPATTGNQLPWQFQLGFAVVLTVLFVILVAVMLGSANSSTGEWQNRVYVFGSVQALVFTAIGWVFGREVQRGQVASAQAGEQEAKHEAREQAGKAEAAQADAAHQRTAVGELATGVRLVAMMPAPSGRTAGAEDVGLDDTPAPSIGELSPAVAELRALADRLHPPA